jgi:hypothetical protein
VDTTSTRRCSNGSLRGKGRRRGDESSTR